MRNEKINHTYSKKMSNVNSRREHNAENRLVEGASMQCNIEAEQHLMITPP